MFEDCSVKLVLLCVIISRVIDDLVKMFFRTLAAVVLICCAAGQTVEGASTASKVISKLKCQSWSIGIYTGDSPFDLKPAPGIKNPVITPSSITGVKASFAADPFMILFDSTWYMFFELKNKKTNQGDIALAVSSDGFKWKFQGIVLDEVFHLSFPHVFEWDGQFYMVPESRQTKSVRLYKALEFPKRWTYVCEIVPGDFVDPCIFYHSGRWWLFVGANPHYNNELRLFYADNLTGPWVEHPKSPIIKNDPMRARPAGRIVFYDGRLYRLAQSAKPIYGSAVRVFEITSLTTTEYREVEIPSSPVLKGSGKGWNARGMHTLDAHEIAPGKWIACVDGRP